MKQAENHTLANVNQLFWIENNCLQSSILNLQKDTLYILCPYGIGDTFYLLSLLSEYLQDKKKKEVCLILKESHRDIPKWFFPKMQVITVGKAVSILNYWSIENQIWQCENYFYGHFKKDTEYHLYPRKEKQMVRSYAVDVLGMDPLKKMQKPAFITDKRAEICDRYQLEKKSIMLMPYAVSCNGIPMLFWEKLARILNMAGYQVFTNGKDESETGIDGTISIYESINDTVIIAEECVAVVALRSGLCDLLAQSDTFLISIDTKEEYFRNWNLTEVGNEDRIVSILFDNISELPELLQNILSILGISLS